MLFHRLDPRALRRHAAAALATVITLCFIAPPAAGEGFADAVRIDRARASKVLPPRANEPAPDPKRVGGMLPLETPVAGPATPRVRARAASRPARDRDAAKLSSPVLGALGPKGGAAVTPRAPLAKAVAPRGLEQVERSPSLPRPGDAIEPARIGRLGNGISLPALPSGRGEGPRHFGSPREAAQAIREAAARRSARIHRLAGFEGYRGQCANAGEPLVLEGTGFGDARGTHTVALMEDRLRVERVAAVAGVASWSPTRIEARMPAGLTPGRVYRVVLRDAEGHAISNGMPVAPCRGGGSLVVDLETTGCAFSHADVRIRARAEASGREFELARIDTGNDFEMRFREDALPLGRYRVGASFRGDPCPGGDWSGARAVEVSHALPSHTVALRYDVAMRETRIAAGVVTGIVQDAFSGMRVRVNNYGPRRGHSRFVPGDAFVELSAALGGARTDLNVPEIREGAFRYYVRDWNLADIGVRRVGDRFRMRLSFESGGREIKGHCFDGVCPFGDDDTAPDGDVNGATVDVFFEPIRYGVGRGTGGDISIGNVEVAIDANLSAQGLAAPVVEIFEGEIKAAIFPRIEQMIVDALEQRPTQVQVATGIRNAIASQGLIEIGSVQGVFLDGADLVIRHLPRRGRTS